MIKKEQELLARVLDIFAQKFDKKAVLRGGMVLRILGSPRLTNDLDYVFVPYKLKKDIITNIISCLELIKGAELDYSLNSKCLRFVLTVENTTIQIEATVAMKVDTSTVSTRLFSPQFNLPQRIIHVVDYPIALANKIAAWNERRLIRDLYDIWFFLQMYVEPDHATLEKRLRKPNYSRLIRPADHFTGRTCSEFYTFMRERVAMLSDETFDVELSDYLPSKEIVGLSAFIRSALVRLN
ncbi:nucleotidyl transferase AbiEii/AbiGii toxin family protein [bacterium]|nr:nucleotidyl transferase AbiEii/AbiGii toxin family protein [bacterium]